ncbi:uncharacterized protein LOC127082674 [Lathyrus oleraceus]|uniref:uncharacterized protein LOC127082674 n=1 Tax=Pisum sativum TaxID=3888 RepID=UPI0021CFF31A|nr:uncharacterized protein LOC127082674 [Pisum sativum]
MTVDSTGKKAVVASQSVKCSYEVKEQPGVVGESKEEEPDYSPQQEEGEPGYYPQSEEEFDEDMYDETNDDIYGDDFVVYCNIVSVLSAEYNMAMKGQIVGYFIVDHAMIEPSLNMVDTNPWRLYFDGSSHKDGTGVGVLISSPQDVPTRFKCRIDKKCSNNKAEYEPLITGLRILKELGASRIEVRGDLELVIKQVTQEYKCIKENLLKYFVTTTQLLEYFEVTEITHVSRNENQEANDLAQNAYGYKMSKSRFQDFNEVRE